VTLKLRQNMQGGQIPQCATTGGEAKPADSAPEIGHPEPFRVVSKGVSTNREGSGRQGMFLKVALAAQAPVKIFVCIQIYFVGVLQVGFPCQAEMWPPPILF
jgi:hypothetical protein